MHHPSPFYRALIGLPWLAWALYWLSGALGNKPTLRRESLGARLAYYLPLLLGAVLLGWRAMPVGWLAMRLWPRSPTPYFIGLALLIAGLGFSVWARVHLGRNWSGTVTVKEGHELIRTGPYGLVRHPIYTGLITAVLGTAIVSGTVRGALALLVITASLIVKLRTEEDFMRETFPDEYPRYAHEVPALIPFTGFPRSAPR